MLYSNILNNCFTVHAMMRNIRSFFSPVANQSIKYTLCPTFSTVSNKNFGITSADRCCYLSCNKRWKVFSHAVCDPLQRRKAYSFPDTKTPVYRKSSSEILSVKRSISSPAKSGLPLYKIDSCCNGIKNSLLTYSRIGGRSFMSVVSGTFFHSFAQGVSAITGNTLKRNLAQPKGIKVRVCVFSSLFTGLFCNSAHI